MNGQKRVYDFHELVNTTNTLNHISAVEYGKNILVLKNNIIRWIMFGKHFISFNMESNGTIWAIIQR